MLRGRVPAKIDDKGRLKVPASFRQLIHDKHGSEIYVTSLDGQSVLLYPMPVWIELENQFATPSSSLHPAVQKFMKITSYYGSPTEMDNQGRVLIQPYLRDSAQMAGDVDVIGAQSYLEVWNHDRCLSSVHGNPLTDEDKRALAELVSVGKGQRT